MIEKRFGEKKFSSRGMYNTKYFRYISKMGEYAKYCGYTEVMRHCGALEKRIEEKIKSAHPLSCHPWQVK
jgi:hypothetical protein